MNEFRGSRKQILDMLDRKDFVDRFNTLLTGTDAIVGRDDSWAPKGVLSPNEVQLRDFEPFRDTWPAQHKNITEWWPKHPARRPVWDMVLTAQIGDKKGLILVEGKAHEGELDRTGKKKDADASDESLHNHEKIRQNIEKACGELSHLIEGFSISRDTHYQLSNRITFAWKLASEGIPTILMYLGFLCDTYFRDYLRDGDHWQRVIGAYLDGIVPLSFPEKWIGCGASKMYMAIRALKVQEISK